MKYIKLLLTIFSVSAFTPKIYNVPINSKNIKVYEPRDVKTENSVLFFTGGNGLIPPTIYNNFLSHLTSKNFSVFIASDDLETNKELLDTLSTDYTSTTTVGHSSSLLNLIKVSNWNKRIKKAVLLDPVKGIETPSIPSFLPLFGWFDDSRVNSNIKFKHIKELKTIRALRSTKWEPFGEKKIPFLLWFSADPKDLIDKEVQLTVDDFPEHGHTDILDNQFADIMHNSISKGIEDRDLEKLDNYHREIATLISDFIVEDDEIVEVSFVEEELTPCSNEITRNNPDMFQKL